MFLMILIVLKISENAINSSDDKFNLQNISYQENEDYKFLQSFK